MREIEPTMKALLEDMDRILSTESAFLVGKWIADARSIGSTDEDKDYFERNARNLITTWGEEDALLNEYGSRTWAGLTKTYYAERWQEFFNDVNAAIEAGVPFDEEAYHKRICEYEGKWWRERLHQFNAEPEGDGKAIAKEIVEKYGALLRGE